MKTRLYPCIRRIRQAAATRLGTTCSCLLLFARPAVVQAQFNYVTNGLAITITGYTGSGGALKIPSIIDGLPVTGIGDAAFFGGVYITGVTIPNSVTSIGNEAFAGCRMTNVVIPSSLTNIGNGAFEDNRLTAITVDTNNAVYSSVDGVLFDKSQSTLVEFPAGIAGGYAVPGSVTNIGDLAFSGCISLTSITIPNGVARIGREAFGVCDSLATVMIGNSVSDIGDLAFEYCTRLTDFTIPISVTNVGSQAFLGCSGLTNATMGESVASIGSGAFGSCTSLTSFAIPKSVTSIGSGAFDGCFNLGAITVDPLNSTYSSSAGVLFDKSQATVIRFPCGRSGIYTIPDSVTNVGSGAFYGCRLASVTLGNNVISIGDVAFEDCGSLAGVTIPNSVTSIGGGAFQDCGSLTSATIPNGVTDIGVHAFDGTGLTNVAIPGSVTSIGDAAFAYCTGLTEIVVDATNSAYSSVAGVLFDKSQTTLIAYPPGRPGRYPIPDSVTSIDHGAFAGCGSMTGVAIPNSVTTIGAQAFADCTSLRGVYFQGNAPAFACNLSGCPFAGDGQAPAYYLPGTTGWGATFAGLPTALWQPQVQAGGTSFGAGTNGFGFPFNWANGLTVVVEASTNLDNPTWISLATNTLSGDSSYFSDAQWTNYPVRFYRLRSP